MSDFAIQDLFRKFIELDRELKELRQEVGEIKWSINHGTTGAVAYSANTPMQNNRYPGEEEWREDLKIIDGPPGHGASYMGVIEYLSDNEKFEEFK